MKKPRILIIDDERNIRDGLAAAFEDQYDIRTAADGVSGIEMLKQRPADIVLTDLRMPGMDGMSFTKEVSSWADAPLIIMLTAYGSIQTAMEAMQYGAYDYLSKPVKLDELEMMVERGMSVLAERRKDAKAEAESQSVHEGLIGKSPEMVAIIEEARQAAQSRSTILITGESGTGKEVFAQLIHRWSDRASKPFVAVHCASLNENLLESELFGHEKGAYTGAVDKGVGRFERADGGTLFLDEIGEISLPVQVKLLRALETRTIERVGGSTPINCDVRVIGATNRNLKKMVAEGTFREDLYFRLNVIHLELPALREHASDIPALLAYYLKTLAAENNRQIDGFSDDALQVLTTYRWPGNIRELRNCVERMVVLCRGSRLTIGDIPEEICQAVSSQFVADDEQTEDAAPDSKPVVAPLDMKASEKQAILNALEQCGGNKSKAAELLGINRRTIQRRMKEWGMG